MRYQPWGETRYSSGTTPTNYTYTGQYSNMDDFGLLFYNARWYDPVIGRFNQSDTIIPFGHGIQAWDRYSYSNNNPIKYSDPSGHFIETAFDIAMIAVDVADIAQNGLSWGNGAALAVDVASAVIPGIPALGGVALKVAKAANTVDSVVDTVNTVDNMVDTTKAIDNTIDTVNIVDNTADAANKLAADRETLIKRTYTVGDESFVYKFDLNKPTALGYSEDVAGVSTNFEPTVHG